MRARLIHIAQSCLLAACAAWLLSACYAEQDAQPVSAAAPVQVGFTLVTSSEGAATRHGEDESGSGYENYIDIANENFRFLLFDNGNKYLETFEPTSVRPADNSEYPQTYYVQGELSKPYSNFKLVVLANWPTYPDNLEAGTTTIADVCETATSVYPYAAGFSPSAENLIPMYGVATITQTLQPNLSTDLGTIDLLRAMSKIEVKCSDENFRLTGVTLHRYSKSGTCAPTGVDGTTTEWYNNEAIHLPDYVQIETTALPFEPVGNSYIVYVPEYKNVDAATPAYISVELETADGETVSLTGEPNIYFQDYDEEGKPQEGTDYDLLRNHWYSYDITHVENGTLTVQYRVMFWDEVESQIGWDVDGHFLMTAAGGDEDDATEGDAEAIYCMVCRPRYNEDYKDHSRLEANASSGASFSFTLTAPEGAVWKAHLSNTEYFQFSTGTWGSGSSKRYVSTGIARKDEYRINITAKNNWTEGDDFDAEANPGFSDNAQIYTDFWITVSLDGETEYVLEINPDNAVSNSKTFYENRRRFAGTNTHIRIWQLRALEEYAYDDLVEEWNYNPWWK